MLPFERRGIACRARRNGNPQARLPSGIVFKHLRRERKSKIGNRLSEAFTADPGASTLRAASATDARSSIDARFPRNLAIRWVCGARESNGLSIKLFTHGKISREINETTEKPDEPLNGRPMFDAEPLAPHLRCAPRVAFHSLFLPMELRNSDPSLRP